MKNTNIGEIKPVRSPLPGIGIFAGELSKGSGRSAYAMSASFAQCSMATGVCQTAFWRLLWRWTCFIFKRARAARVSSCELRSGVGIPSGRRAQTAPAEHCLRRDRKLSHVGGDDLRTNALVKRFLCTTTALGLPTSEKRAITSLRCRPGYVPPRRSCCASLRTAFIVVAYEG